jgi:DNA-binding response OmpR family regulator
MRILVVEDDALVADAIRRGLTSAGFAVDQVATAEEADSAIAMGEFDLAVIDIGLPKADGLSLVRKIRRDGRTLPVLIVTARDALADRVSALDTGADDYLIKPFEIPELQARCRALIRRTRSATSAELNIGTLALDLAGRQLRVDGRDVELTRREWSILECLALELGRVVSKDRLLRAIAAWDEELTPNAVEVYVSRLRAKLGTAAALRTVRGLGYRLDEPAGAE